MGLGEAGPAGAHADVGVDQVGEDVLPTDRPDGDVAPDHQRLHLPGSFKADGAGLGLPRFGQQRRGELAVLGAAGGERRRVVGPHSLGFRLVLLAPGLQLGLDLQRALGKRAQLVAGEAHHLTATVAVGAPLDAQVPAQQPAQLGLEQAAGGLLPLMEGMGVEGHVGAVGPLHDVGDQAMGVELGVALARGPVDEGGHREAVRPHPPAHAALLLAGVGGLVLQERQCGGDGLGVGAGDDRRRLGRPERPQQRHRLGTGVGGVEGERLPLAVAFQQVDAGAGMHALDQGPQLVGLDHGRPDRARPPTGPATRLAPRRRRGSTRRCRGRRRR